MKIKQQKNPYRRLNTAQEIADTIEQHITGIDKTYYNPSKPNKHKMGKALDVGVFVMRNGVSIEELIFMVDFIKKHKEFIRSKI